MSTGPNQFYFHFIGPLRNTSSDFVEPSFAYLGMTLGIIGTLFYLIPIVLWRTERIRTLFLISALSFVVWALLMFQGGTVHEGQFTFMFTLLILSVAALFKNTATKILLGVIIAVNSSVTLWTFQKQKFYNHNCLIDTRTSLYSLGQNCTFETTAGFEIARMRVLERGVTSFTGRDFQLTSQNGYDVRGTGSLGDAETGRLEISVEKEGIFFIRTGPDSDNQLMQFMIDDVVIDTLDGQVFENWEAIYMNPIQTTGTLKIVITDFGTGWGQWIAVAFKNAQE